MPCIKCSTGKWKIGAGKCIYDTLTACQNALRGYYSKKYEKKRKK